MPKKAKKAKKKVKKKTKTKETPPPTPVTEAKPVVPPSADSLANQPDLLVPLPKKSIIADTMSTTIWTAANMDKAFELNRRIRVGA